MKYTYSNCVLQASQALWFEVKNRKEQNEKTRGASICTPTKQTLL
jgi:hypothetical protein